MRHALQTAPERTNQRKEKGRRGGLTICKAIDKDSWAAKAVWIHTSLCDVGYVLQYQKKSVDDWNVDGKLLGRLTHSHFLVVYSKSFSDRINDLHLNILRLVLYGFFLSIRRLIIQKTLQRSSYSSTIYRRRVISYGWCVFTASFYGASAFRSIAYVENAPTPWAPPLSFVFLPQMDLAWITCYIYIKAERREMTTHFRFFFFFFFFSYASAASSMKTRADDSITAGGHHRGCKNQEERRDMIPWE